MARRLNLERNIGPRQVQAPPSPSATSSNDGTPAAGIPMLDESALRRLRSGKALERMLTSQNSEDWVSWTVFRTLERQASWWPSLIRIANLEGLDAREVPSLEFWGEFPSPGSYERASRRRMEASANPEIQARARYLKPVEGYTEVDIMLDGLHVLWFIEAKLHSDLSCRTTYDSTRNQLVRNIDVLLERARGRRSIMSLMVLDRLPGRYHSQLLAHYHHNPEALYALLPHRPPAEVESVLRDLRVLLWSDVLPLLGRFEPAAVREELWRRCSWKGMG